MGDFVFEETRDARVYEWTHLQNASWRQNLSAEEYMQRERHLGQTRVCDVQRDDDQEHGIHYYVMRDNSIEYDAEQKSEVYDLTYNIVSSCETLHRKSWKFFIDEDNVKRIDVLSPCIGAVYTLEHYRGRGYAKEMIKRLQLKLQSTLSEDNFITLYSEVGNFYEQFNYRSFEVPLFEFPVVKEPVPLDPRVSFVEFEGFNDLVTIFHGKFLKNVYQQMGQDEAKRNRIALVPTIDVVEWHHARSNFFSNVIHGVNAGHLGVQVTDESGVNLTGFIIFTHDYAKKAIYLVMVYAVDFATLKTLLDALQHEAQFLNYGSVIGWESDLFDYKVLFDDDKEKDDAELKDYIETTLHGELGKPNGSISAVHMLDKDNNVVWHGNGKWPWF